MFFDRKSQLEKEQFKRVLKDDTILYQGICLPCKNNQGYCDPATQTQATIVWFPEDTRTLFQVAKFYAKKKRFFFNQIFFL